MNEKLSVLARRDFLVGASALAATGLVHRALATSFSPGERIDSHHHFGPPEWRTFLADRKLLYHAWNGWTPAQSVRELDQAGFDKALLSITYPGIWLGKDAATAQQTRELSRSCNVYGAKMKADYPGRFGVFAVLPLPDVDGSLKEIEYAFDTLKLEGVGILTSYGDQWVGDAKFTPVMEELNRRKAVVFTHANVPSCCTRGGSGAQRYLVPGVNNNVIEYGTDTTRAIMSLVVIDAADRYPNIRFSFSHGGGTMPYLIERILGRTEMASLTDTSRPNARLHQLRQFYYDTANANNVVAMTALKKVVGTSQIMFGTDFPYEGPVAQQATDLRSCGVFSGSELKAVFGDNARRFLVAAKA